MLSAERVARLALLDEEDLPARQGRNAFAYLVLNRDRRMSRDELLTAVYGEEASPGQHPSLSVLLSKLRSVIGQELLSGRSEIELVLPRDAFVDVEAAREARRQGLLLASECDRVMIKLTGSP
jgi:DNA-binding SARP family transcriptional activator